MDGQNVVFKFDHAAYVTQYEKPQWSSLHFAYCISYEQMMKLETAGPAVFGTDAGGHRTGRKQGA